MIINYLLKAYTVTAPSTLSKLNPRMLKIIIIYLLKAYSPVNCVKNESAHVQNDDYLFIEGSAHVNDDNNNS